MAEEASEELRVIDRSVGAEPAACGQPNVVPPAGAYDDRGRHPVAVRLLNISHDSADCTASGGAATVPPVRWHSDGMDPLAAFDALSAVGRRVICGLVREYGDPVRALSYEYAVQRDNATWNAVIAALDAAARGEVARVATVDPPGWLEPLVRRRLSNLSGHWPQFAAFLPIRLLERRGLVQVPHDDTYVLAIVSALGDRRNMTSRTDALRTDSGLLETLWRVFEVEGGGEISLANIDKYSVPAASWQQTFLDLVDGATLPRGRTLEACLDALRRDFSAYRAQWFAALYEALQPEPAEMSQHQDRLRALIASPVAPTVALAVRKLASVAGTGLDAEATLTVLGPAMGARAKSTATAALRLVASIVTLRPDLGPLAIPVVAAALQHQHADVQRRAVTLLGRVGANDVANAAMAELLPSVQHAIGSPLTADDAVIDPLPSDIRAGPPVVPIKPPELLERLAGVLENPRDVIELELVLAALARLEDPTKLTPLAKRATALLTSRSESDQPGSLTGQLAHTVLLAAGKSAVVTRPTRPIETFLRRRLDEVEAVLTGRAAPRTLAATPDSPAGWVSAEALIQRLSGEPRPRHHDVIAALLRLNPRERPSPAAGKALDGELAEAVRHALGAASSTASTREAARKISTPAWWVAASRAREPLAVDEHLLAAGLDRNGQGRPLSTTLSVTGDPRRWKVSGRTYSGTSWTWTIGTGDRPGNWIDDQPTVLTGSPSITGGPADWIPWAASVWPHDAEHFLVERGQSVLHAASWDQVLWDVVPVLTALLAHPGHLGTLAATTLASGLAGSTTEQRVIAVDGVISHLASGRLSGSDLGKAMAQVSGPARPNRWVASLRDLGAAVPAGPHHLVDILSVLLPQLPYDHHGLSALVELLLEQVLTSRRSTDEPLTTWLLQVPASTRAGRAARQILSIDSSP